MGMAMLLGLVVVFLTVISFTARAGFLETPTGSQIAPEVVAPAGGGAMDNARGNNVTGTLGQVTVGTSLSPGGSEIIHGIGYLEEAVYPDGIVFH